MRINIFIAAAIMTGLSVFMVNNYLNAAENSEIKQAGKPEAR